MRVGMKEKPIVVLLGYTAVGKDTLLKKLVDEAGYFPIISHTTRPIRPNEENGREYNFTTKDTFLEMETNGEFVETREYNTLLNESPDTWYYGISKSAIKDSLPSATILDIDGLIDFKKVYRSRIISIFITAGKEELIRRCKLRGDYDRSEFDRRLEDDMKRFTPNVLANEVDEIIYSTNVEDNFMQILKIIGDLKEYK